MTSVAAELIFENLSREIIGAAMEVLNVLKPGLDEKLYERALILELESRGHAICCQKRFRVTYREKHIGTLIPDIIVEDSVLVDTKVVSAFTANHLAQMIGYLAITKLELAILLNFGQAELRWKRVVRQPSLKN